MSGMVDMFIEFVKIDSESCEEKEFMQHLKGLLESELEARCSFDDFGNITALIDGKGGSKKDPILLSCHGDTVKPGKGIKPVIKEGVIYSSGDTVLGSDDKAGIAEAIWALKTAKKHPPIEFVITVQEEVGLKGARNFDVSKLKSKMGFLLDSGPLDTILIGGPCKINFDTKFKGKSVHSGMEPEKGISAIQAAAIAISQMKLGRIDDKTTANIGVIKGGLIRNGIPDSCELLGEARGMDNERARAQADHMEECFKAAAKKVGASVDIGRDEIYQAIRVKSDEPALEVARKAIRSIGLEPKEEVVNGGTDGSIYNAKGVPTVVLGMGQDREHTVEERIAIEDMERTVKILHNIFEQLA